MAKPSTREGYIQAGYEWLASVLTGRFSHLQRVVLFEVYVQVYGLAGRDHAALSPTEVARRIGREPTHVSRAIRELVAAGVLEDAGGQRYRPVERYDLWDLGEKDEARRARVAYCLGAARLAKSFGRPAGPEPAPAARVDPQRQFAFQTEPARDPAVPPPPPDLTKSGQEDDQIWSSGMTKSGHGYDQIWSYPMTKSGHTEGGAYIGTPARIENSEEKLRLFLGDAGAPGGDTEPVKKIPESPQEDRVAELIRRSLAMHQERQQRGAGDG